MSSEQPDTQKATEEGTVASAAAATTIPQIAEATAMAHGATAEVRYVRMYPPTVNHEAETERAATPTPGWRRPT